MEITKEIEERIKEVYKYENDREEARKEYRKQFTLQDLIDGKEISVIERCMRYGLWNGSMGMYIYVPSRKELKEMNIWVKLSEKK